MLKKPGADLVGLAVDSLWLQFLGMKQTLTRWHFC